MKKVLSFLSEIEFYLKVAIACTIVQQLFYLVLHDLKLNFITQVLLYWSIGFISFYSLGFFIEEIIKKNDTLREKLNIRTKQIKK